MTDLGEVLPTPAEVLGNAERLLSQIYALAGDVGDELRSDVSVPWTSNQAASKREIFAALDGIKKLINETR